MTADVVRRADAQAKRLKAEAAEARGELALVTGAKVSLEEHVETEMVTQRRQLEDLERSELSLRERESRLQKELSRTTTDFSTAKTSLQVESTPVTSTRLAHACSSPSNSHAAAREPRDWALGTLGMVVTTFGLTRQARTLPHAALAVLSSQLTPPRCTWLHWVGP